MNESLRQKIERLLADTKESIALKKSAIEIAKANEQFHDAMIEKIKLQLLLGYEYRLEEILK